MQSPGMNTVDLGYGDGKTKVDGSLGNKKCTFVLLLLRDITN